MSHGLSSRAAPRGAAGVKVWHLAVLVGFVAVAIRDIQDHGRREPALIALAAAGFALYGAIACAAWVLARRYGTRLRPLAVFALYAVAMAALFLVATVGYLVIEYAYVTSR